MKEQRDFSCEIMGLIALTALSALSHFWYILIAIGIVAAIGGAGLLFALIFLRISRDLHARVIHPALAEDLSVETTISMNDGRRAGPSLPVVQMSAIRD